MRAVAVKTLQFATDTPTGRTSSRSTRNYEIDRTVRHVRNATGGVQRITVAVVVNERPAPAPAPGASAPAAGAASRDGRGRRLLKPNPRFF